MPRRKCRLASTFSLITEIEVKLVDNGEMFLMFQINFLQLIQVREVLDSFDTKHGELNKSDEFNKMRESIGYSSVDFVLCIRLDF